ncbi:MAG: carboxylesterase family protein [Acidobacteriota bacterium]|nr:carboxylesterase family protein [Acidobacteriota bacterium]
MKCPRLIWVAAFCAALVASQAAGGQASSASVMRIESGLVRGTARDGLMIFKGIPYAQPPVGKLRWQPPQPAKAWKGIRSTIRFGHDCMQLPFPGDAAPLRTDPSEDWQSQWSGLAALEPDHAGRKSNHEFHGRKP